MKTAWLIVLVAFAAALPARAAEPGPRPSEYKSVDNPDGDVYLILERDGAFVLVLDRIDRQADRSIGHEKMKGTWEEKDGTVRLVSDDATIVYRREPASFSIDQKSHTLDALRWESSTRATFAGESMLVDRIGMERLAYRFAPPPPPPTPGGPR